MPATPTIFSTPPRAVKTLRRGSRSPFLVRVGNRLAAWIDTFAPEAYEDETGFHPLPVRSSDSRAPLGELNCLGEHI